MSDIFCTHICVHFLSTSCYCLAGVCIVFSSVPSTFFLLSVTRFPVVKELWLFMYYLIKPNKVKINLSTIRSISKVVFSWN